MIFKKMLENPANVNESTSIRGSQYKDKKGNEK